MTFTLVLRSSNQSDARLVRQSEAAALARVTVPGIVQRAHDPARGMQIALAIGAQIITYTVVVESSALAVRLAQRRACGCILHAAKGKCSIHLAIAIDRVAGA